MGKHGVPQVGQGPQPRIRAPGHGRPRCPLFPPGREHPAQAPTTDSATAQKHNQPPTRVHSTGGGCPARGPHRGSVASPSSFHSLRLNKGKVEKLKGSTPASVRAEQWGPVLVVFLY